MIHPLLASLMAGLLVFPSLVCADPPQLSGTSPLGVQRGKSMEVAFQGSGLVDKPTLVAPFGFQLEETTGSQPGATSWNVRLTVDARTAVGVYPVRVVTDSGVSNPILFAVGQVGQVSRGRAEQLLRHRAADPEPRRGRR